MEKRVLFIDADPQFASRIASDLRGLGVILSHVEDQEELLRALVERPPTLLLIGELPTIDPFSLRDRIAGLSTWNGPAVVIHDGTTPSDVLSHGASPLAAEAYLDRHGDPTENSQRIGWLLEASRGEGLPVFGVAVDDEEVGDIVPGADDEPGFLVEEEVPRSPQRPPSQALFDMLHAELTEAQAEKASLAEELRLVRQERERVQDDLAAQIAALAGELAKKDAELASLRRQLEARQDSGPGDGELEELRAENEFLAAEIDRLGARLLQGTG